MWPIRSETQPNYTESENCCFTEVERRPGLKLDAKSEYCSHNISKQNKNQHLSTYLEKFTGIAQMQGIEKGIEKMLQ